jgi:hydroxymethylglutaryl-CoA synthase
LDNSASLSDDIKQRLEKFKGLTEEETYADKSLETELVKLSEELFKQKTQSSLLFSTLIGNMYTPSLYGCLISHLVSAPYKSLDKSRIVLFSYGSGFAATMYSIVINEANNSDQFSLRKIIDNLTEKRNLLDDRIDVDPVLFDKYLHHRQLNHKRGELNFDERSLKR